MRDEDNITTVYTEDVPVRPRPPPPGASAAAAD